MQIKPLNKKTKKIKKIRKKKKSHVFIQSLMGVNKQGPSFCWLEVLLAGEHQT